MTSPQKRQDSAPPSRPATQYALILGLLGLAAALTILAVIFYVSQRPAGQPGAIPPLARSS